MMGLFGLAVTLGICLVLIVAVILAIYVIAQERDARKRRD
jgi:hypothetical protein